MAFPPIIFKNNQLKLLDQRQLPKKETWLTCKSAEEVVRAIQTMVVRGAPAIGIAGAYGLYVGIRNFKGSPQNFLKVFRAKARILREARPTAVNLPWAIDRIEKKVLSQKKLPVEELKKLIREEAEAIRKEDEKLCRLIGKHGAAVFRAGESVLTHCNAGGLATSGFGTALAVFYTLREKGKPFRVYATETRPLLQGARLTAWELSKSKIPCTLICESAVGSLMRQGKIQRVVVGADRIAANGDTANKIGTYSIALLARAHEIPFYIAAPSTTLDPSLPSGEKIPIETRKPEEITRGFGRETAPRGIRVENPAFDVTPHGLITAFFTEKGVIYPPYKKNLQVLVPPSLRAPQSGAKQSLPTRLLRLRQEAWRILAMTVFKSHSEEETLRLAERFGKKIRSGTVVALTGEIGAGKTVFIKGLCRGLGVKNSDEVKSPTFVLLHFYQGKVPIHHFDLYRLEREKELDALGFDEFLSNKSAVSLIEWADRAPRRIPKNAIWIELKITSPTSRRIRIGIRIGDSPQKRGLSPLPSTLYTSPPRSMADPRND